MGDIDLTLKKERYNILKILDKENASILIVDSRLGGQEATMAGLMILDEALSEPEWNWKIDQCYLITHWESLLIDELFNVTGYWPRNARLLQPDIHFLKKDTVYDGTIKKCHIQIKNAVKRGISLKGEKPITGIIGESNAIKQIHSLIHKMHQTSTSVLITGESGTGKELVARAIHYECINEKAHPDCRKNNPFIPINCAEIPENLLESELFGHEKGAFTSADSQKKGLFEEADGGTLFLDEITEMPTYLQSKLLRVLQERQFRRLGGTMMINVDIRVICATNKDINKEVQNGTFREDLFYRINVLNIHIKPLRKRREDIPILMNYFINRYCKKQNIKIPIIEKEAYKKFQEYNWPGNVRELENCIERSLILYSGRKFEWRKTLNGVKNENIQKPNSQNEYEEIWKQIHSGKREPKKLVELSKEFNNDMLVLTIMAFAIRDVGNGNWLDTDPAKKYFNEKKDNFKQWAHTRKYNKKRILSLI